MASCPEGIQHLRGLSPTNHPPRTQLRSTQTQQQQQQGYSQAQQQQQEQEQEQEHKNTRTQEQEQQEKTTKRFDHRFRKRGT